MSYRQRKKTQAPRVVEVMRPEDSAKVREEQIKAAKAQQALVDLEATEKTIASNKAYAEVLLQEAKSQAEKIVSTAKEESRRIMLEASMFKQTLDADRKEFEAKRASGLSRQDARDVELKARADNCETWESELLKRETALGTTSQKLTNEGARLANWEKRLLAQHTDLQDKERAIKQAKDALAAREAELKEWDSALSTKHEELQKQIAQVKSDFQKNYRDREMYDAEAKKLAGAKEAAELELGLQQAETKALREEYRQTQLSLAKAVEVREEITRREEDVIRRERALAQKSRELGYQREEFRGAEKNYQEQIDKLKKVNRYLEDKVAVLHEKVMKRGRD